MKLLVYESGREYDLEGPVIVDEDPVHGKVVHGGGIGVVVKKGFPQEEECIRVFTRLVPVLLCRPKGELPMRDPTELAVLVDAVHQLRGVYLTLYHDGFPLLREASPLWAILRSEGLLKFSDEIPLALGTYRGPPWWLVGWCATPDGPMGMYFSGVLLLRLITFYSRPWKVGEYNFEELVLEADPVPIKVNYTLPKAIVDLSMLLSFFVYTDFDERQRSFIKKLEDVATSLRRPGVTVVYCDLDAIFDSEVLAPIRTSLEEFKRKFPTIMTNLVSEPFLGA